MTTASVLPRSVPDCLTAAVLANPKDDAPRLVYADWLDEHAGDMPCERCHGDGTVGVTFLYGNLESPTEPTHRLPSGCTNCGGSGRVFNGFAERAEFIRVQCELARMGPPHVVVNERCVLERKYGPNYYTLTGGEGTEGGRRLIQEVKVGDRVDVLKPRGNKGRPLYGLRVHKITADEVIIVNDSKSGPWPGTALRERERALLEHYWEDDLGWVGIKTPGQQWLCTNIYGPPDLPEVSWVTFRRGFVAEVRLTCVAFVADGGPCGMCNGGTMAVAPSGCPFCSGSGRLPGLAATLFKLLPLETVVLTDKSPLVHGSKKAYWHDETDVHNGHMNLNSDLPRKLFDLLTGEGQRERMLRRWSAKIFASSSLAVDALNRACVQWGRSQAGLPELP